MRCFVVAAYAVPAAAAWLVLGACLTALQLAGVALAGVALFGAVGYGCYYGLIEISGRRGLAPPGRRWQVPQSMMIDASPRGRVLVWGAILGPGFVTRNPYAGFGMLPLAVAAILGTGAGAGAALGLAAAIGLAHGTARAAALLRDVHHVPDAPDPLGSRAQGSLDEPGERRVADGSASVLAGTVAHLDVLLKTVYWRRYDGVVLLAIAATAAVAAVRYFS